MLYHRNTKKIQSKNVRKFTSRSDVYNYLSSEVFVTEHFVEHVIKTAKATEINYLLAYDIITNYLTDLLYEIDTQITMDKKVRIRGYRYFSFNIGFMISNIKEQYTELLKLNRKEKNNEQTRK